LVAMATSLEGKAQPMPKAAYRNDHRDRPNRPG